MAGGTIVAGVVFTAADRGAAVAARISRRASAGVAIGTFLARATVLARVRRTLVPGVVTVHAGEAVWTLTQVRVHKIHTACTIGAGAGGAVVNLLLTVEPCVSRGALAEIASVRVVSTAASIGARPISTRHGA